MYLSMTLPDLFVPTLIVRGLFVLITMWSELPQLARHPHNDILTLPDENELAQNAIRFNSYSGTVFSKIQLVNLSK